MFLLNQIQITLEITGFPDPAFFQEINPQAHEFLRNLGNPQRVNFLDHFAQIHNIQGFRNKRNSIQR